VHRLNANFLGLLACLALIACAAPNMPPPQGGYRKAGAPIYSSVQVESARLAGDWRQVAAFGPAGCAPGGVTISAKGALQAGYRLCLSGREVKGGGAMQPAGPGRFVVGGRAWWVLWADADYRTLVIGTPDGSFGFVLDRTGAISPDRLKAAREILEWNGYDLSRLAVL
jgi:apolipoprotein D and lipocalin family protein